MAVDEGAVPIIALDDFKVLGFTDGADRGNHGGNPFWLMAGRDVLFQFFLLSSF